MSNFDDAAAIRRLRAVFQEQMNRAPGGDRSIDTPYYDYGYYEAPNQTFSTPPSEISLPPAQVYASGGAVDTLGGYDDYGSGRFTRTPAERRENRERRIEQWAPPSPEDDWGAREWSRFGTIHNYNPLSYGMEALGRLDSAGRDWEGRDYWNNLLDPNPHLYEKTGSLLGATADAASILTMGLPGKAAKVISMALPALYDVGDEIGHAILGKREGGLVSRALRKIGSSFGETQARRAEQAADLTNLERFNEKSLVDLFDPGNRDKGGGLFVAMPTDRFQDYAPQLPQSAVDAVPYPRWKNVPRSAARGIDPMDRSQDTYLDLLGRRIQAKGLDEAPTLWLSRTADPLTQVVEHEGRHRTMALGRLGEDRALVNLRPANSGEMRGDIDERLERLMEKYFPRGAGTLILPQDSGFNRVPRALYDEPFADGGKVLSKLARNILGKPKQARLPGGETIEALPIREFEDVAETFARKHGNSLPSEYAPFDEDRARRIAEAYDVMRHDPLDPQVRRSYDALIDETMDQYKALEGTGAKFEFLRPGEVDPYAASPALGYLDLLENGRLKVFPTDSGFGTLSDISDNPLLRRVGRVGDLEDATANDAFRVVHDALGHFGPGNPFFRHQGEERAWDMHRRAYSPEALPAMTSETRGQNSWVNFGPYGERNRTASGADTIFADQKTGILPPWAYEDGYKSGGSIASKAWRTLRSKNLEKEVLELNKGLGKPSDPFVTPDIDKRLQTVSDPQRVMFPGIYKDAPDLIEEARSRLVPDRGEDSPMFRLFGHTRQSLDELAQGNRDLDSFRPGIGYEHPFTPSSRARGAAVSDQVLTNRNASRILDVLGLANADPELRATRSWYEMSPLWEHADRLGVGDIGPYGKRAFNTRLGVMSPASDPTTEIERGVLANYLAHEGRTDDFVRYGGVPDEQRGDWFPRDMLGMKSHAYHSTAHVPNLLDFETTGKLWSPKHKVPTYVAATDPVFPYGERPVADAHFTRFLGYPDVRTANSQGTLRAELSGSEYGDMYPWWNSKVADQLDLRPRDAQALMWNVGGPQTGVRYIGPSKLEMISDFMDRSAHKLGVSPETARDLILTGQSPGFADGGRVDDDFLLYHPQMFGRYEDGGIVNDDDDDDLYLGYVTMNYDHGGPTRRGYFGS